MKLLAIAFGPKRPTARWNGCLWCCCRVPKIICTSLVSVKTEQHWLNHVKSVDQKAIPVLTVFATEEKEACSLIAIAACRPRAVQPFESFPPSVAVSAEVPDCSGVLLVEAGGHRWCDLGMQQTCGLGSSRVIKGIDCPVYIV